MKFALAAVALSIAILMAGCFEQGRRLEVRSPCNTFVSESAPRTTPEIRKVANGLEVLVSFTPAVDAEAAAIRGAVENGAADLIVYPDLTRLNAVGLEDHLLVLSVASEAEAAVALKALCFGG